MSSPDFSEAILRAYHEEASELVLKTERNLDTLFGDDQAARPEALKELLRHLHTLKGTSAAVGVGLVKDVAHKLEDLLKPISSGEAAITDELKDEIYEGVDSINAELESLRGNSSASSGDSGSSMASGGDVGEAVQPSNRRDKEETLRIRSERLDSLHALVSELIVGGLQSEGVTQSLYSLRERCNQAQIAWEGIRSELLAHRDNLPENLRKNLSKSLEGLSETLTDCASQSSLAAREVPMLYAQNNTVVNALDEAISELRLVPLQPFLEGYGRAVRDACRVTGKKANLQVNAGGAEMDRLVLTQLKDPLIHLVRNSVVHGIESPEVRKDMGKDEAGLVRVEVSCRGERATLRVIDDGSGVDEEKVKKKAAQLGLIAPEKDLDDKDLLFLLTHPGFSSRDEVDELAGRGVGLDVVATSIRNLDGRLTLDNIPGIGSVFTIDVPITASTTSGCRVRVGNSEFGMMMKNVEKIVRVAGEEIVSIEGRRVLYLEGDPISVVPLARVLGRPESDAKAKAKRIAVVVRQRRELLALLVDDVPTEQTMVIKPLGPAFQKASLFLGGAVQADHGVLPILHLPEIFNRVQSVSMVGGTAATVSKVTRTRRTRVLAVDDSLTMRSMMRQLLESNGYEVVLAHDGLAGLETFEKKGPFDVVVTDLQMPNVDGIALCEGLRGKKRSQVPIVMVTSVGDPSERQRALEAGADSYIVKNELQKQSFLKLIGSISGRDSKS